MSREQQYTAIVLKKQALAEADEIITFFSKEAGKLRAVGKSTKSSKSKLIYGLQPMFLCELALAGHGRLPKVIRASAKKTFGLVQEDAAKIKVWYIACELVLTATPDEQPNEAVFEALLGLLEALDQELNSNDIIRTLLVFKILFIEALGFKIIVPSSGSNFIFNPALGGFVVSEKPFIKPETIFAFNELEQKGYLAIKNDLFIAELPQLLLNFLQFHLERDLKSERTI